MVKDKVGDKREREGDLLRGTFSKRVVSFCGSTCVDEPPKSTGYSPKATCDSSFSLSSLSLEYASNSNSTFRSFTKLSRKPSTIHHRSALTTRSSKSSLFLFIPAITQLTHSFAL